MKRHEIETEGLLDFQNQVLTVYAKTSIKVLYITGNGGYQVRKKQSKESWDFSELVCETSIAEVAVEAYNDLP